MKPLLVLIVLSAGAVGLASSARSSLCGTLHSNFLRRQLEEIGWKTPFPVGIDPTHTPYVTFDEGGNATVTIGNGNEPRGRYHAMTPSDVPNLIHYIAHIYVFDQNDEIIANRNMSPFNPSPATFTFSIPPGTTSITAYQFCNRHGLWKGDKTAVPVQHINNAMSHAGNRLDYGYKCSLLQPDKISFMSQHADMIRRQFYLFNRYTPFNKVIDAPNSFVELLAETHSPIIELASDRRSGHVLVGNYSGATHPMIASIGGSTPHWIEMIYVVDQDDTVIAMQALDPTDPPFMGLMYFSIPDSGSVTKVRALQKCNIHGLWEGPYVQITDDGRGNNNDGIEDKIIDADNDGTTSSGNHNAVLGVGLFQVLCLVLLL
eukprot:scaffold43696_cov48-Attheya_sp.AAC.3